MWWPSCIEELGKPCIVEVGEIESVDIDEAEDFMIADAIYNHLILQGS